MTHNLTNWNEMPCFRVNMTCWAATIGPVKNIPKKLWVISPDVKQKECN